jgi:hypothetical protein
MTFRRAMRGCLLAATVAALAGCGFGGKGKPRRVAEPEHVTTLGELFAKQPNPNATVEVNKYIYFAAQDVLNFLPIETADPFTGVIVTGWGTPPGGGPAYKATIYVEDPAMDARSLKLALMTRSGPASPATVRAVEDAILTRARQLRIAEGKL